MQRRVSRVIKVGPLSMGGEYPVVVQTMTKTDTRDVAATVNQIHVLEEHGAELVRLAVKDMEAARALREIKREVSVPLVADIHFDPVLALASIDAGVDKIRLNPSNIKDPAMVLEVARAAKVASIPIRVGANLGSMDPRLTRSGRARALADEALREAHLLEEADFHDIVISVKSSDVREMVEAARIVAGASDYPLHLGVTEAGPLNQSLIKSSAGIGSLLMEGIGDTIRYSISGDPVLEVDAAWTLLAALDLRKHGAQIVSCPTCGRCEVPDLLALVGQLERRIGEIKKPLSVALMGCVVNGVGEGKSADLGIACGRDQGILFIHGEPVRNVKPDEFIDTLIAEANKL
ncbi:MAG: flavodoxin-dependent (E)-4-hydroxy-3-methylbut-2-enyl-diphosphate synthase [Candidatus Cryosericum sp.]